ncbi:LysR family transcriptional regulator [Pseudoalteromonas sp. SMS1]|uniref:LysR family transcriptional regulator n=1 Tax=Pseudoalteromonas sp. SMS1 TaxID=2908894 RepID=UPI001F3A19F3|nr:LysR family transcriptional regulator [Pseudoalteromonas sp. SMS1]MCF2856724.1 LysR family transcriptional regulator [Pseudoalteromonas sp. SMS1]
MNKLRHMSLFAHIVESGSITAAAQSLALSKSVLSQHLKALEQDLGVTLLKRTTRRQRLTSAGKTFYEQCKILNQTALHAWHEAQQYSLVAKGKVRITAPNALMSTLIAPALAEVCITHPQLEPELIADDRQLDLLEDNIDLAIRVGHSKDCDAKQRWIGEFKDVLCGTAEVVKNYQPDQHRYIANLWQGSDIHHTLKNEHGECKQFTAIASCVVNSFDTNFALINNGAGIGLVPEFKLTEPDCNLHPVFPGFVLASNPVYALYTFSKQVPLSISVCLQGIEAQLANTMA